MCKHAVSRGPRIDIKLRWIDGLRFLLTWITMMTGVGADFCGGQNWHCAWMSDYKITYQVQSHTNSLSVYGGKTEAPANLQSFTSSIGSSLYDQSDSTAAILVKVTNADKYPTHAALLSRINDGGIVHIVGVQAVFGARNDQILAVLETDAADGRVFIALQNLNWEQKMSQGDVIKITRSGLTNWHMTGLADNNFKQRIWLLADDATSGSTLQIRLRRAEANGSTVLQQIASVSSASGFKDHKLQAVAMNENYLFRVTKGSCKGVSGKGILVTISHHSSHSINSIDKAVCIDSSDAKIVSKFGSVLDFSARGLSFPQTKGECAVSMEDSTYQQHIYVATMIYDNLPAVLNIRKLAFNDGSKIQLLSVGNKQASQSGTCEDGYQCETTLTFYPASAPGSSKSDCRAACGSDKCKDKKYQCSLTSVAHMSSTLCQSDCVQEDYRVNLLVRKTDQTTGWTLWVNTRDPITGQNEATLKVIPSAAVPSLDPKLTDISSFMGFFYDETIFILHGKDYTIKMPLSSTNEDKECLTSGFKTGGENLLQDKVEKNYIASDQATEFQWIDEKSNVPHHDFGYLYAQKVDNIDKKIEQNVCGYEFGEMFSPTSKNLLFYVEKALDSTALAYPQCRDNSDVVTKSPSSFKYSLQGLQSGAQSYVTSTAINQKSDYEASIKVKSIDVPSLDPGTYTLSYRFWPTSYSDPYRALLPQKSTTITLIKKCDIVMPSKEDIATNGMFFDGFTQVTQYPKLLITFSNWSIGCAYEVSILNIDGSSFDSALYAKSDDSNWYFETQDPIHDSKTYDLLFRVASQMEPVNYFGEIPFNVTFRMSPCTKQWQFPANLNAFDTVYTIDVDEQMTIQFYNVSITDCPFQLSLWNVTNPSGPVQVNTPNITLFQPELILSSADPRMISVGRFGYMLVEFKDNRLRSTSQLELRVICNSYEGETNYQAIKFELKVQPCPSVNQDKTVMFYKDFQYILGDPAVYLPAVTVQDAECKNSYLTLVPDPLPDGYSATNDTISRTLSIKIEGLEVKELAQGYISVYEIDIFTGYKVKTDFIVSIVPRVQINVTLPIQPNDTENFESNQANDTTESQVVEDESSKNQIGNHTFVPIWNKVQLGRIQKNAKVLGLALQQPSMQGYLDLIFTDSVKLRHSAKNWNSENEGGSIIQIDYLMSESTEDLIDGDDLEPIIASWEITDANEDSASSLEDEPADTNLMRIDQLRLKLEFSNPSFVSIFDIDKVQVKIAKEIFLDEVENSKPNNIIFIDMSHIEKKKTLKVPTQVSKEQLEVIEAIVAATENFLKAFFGTNVFISLFNASAWQYLWGLINAIQIIILSSLFEIYLPINAAIVIEAIWHLVSLDVFQTEAIFETMFGFRETEPYQTKQDKQGEAKSSFADAGYDSANFIQLIGPIFFIPFAFVLLIALRRLSERCTSSMKVNCLIKKIRSQFNKKVIILRFMLEGCIEIGISAMIQILMVSPKSVLLHITLIFVL